MRWSVVKVAVAFLVLISSNITAQPPAEDSLILSTGCGRFHLVLGRLTLDTFRYKKVRLHQSLGENTDDEEFVCVTANHGTPSLHYLRQIGPSRITLDTTDTDAIRIESRTTHPSGVVESVLIQQPSQGMIRLTSTLGSKEQQLETASIWHLMVEQPTLFEQQVRPVLSLLIDRCRLERFTEAIGRKLQQRANEEPILTRAYVRQLVNRLGSPKRNLRLRAQRELAKCGVGILPLLDNLKPEFLDTEQKRRILEVRRQVSHMRSDTPDRVAAWLATDRDYWLSVCQQWQRADQERANQYLIATCGEGLEYPSGTILAADPQSLRR